MNHRPPRPHTLTSLTVLSDHIQSLPYGEEDLAWIWNVLTPYEQENLTQLPWNVQWRIWLRNECQQLEQKRKVVGRLEHIVVTLQEIFLKKATRDDAEHHHDLVMLTSDQELAEEPWTQDFMLQNWSASQRYHVYRDVSNCWKEWNSDQRRDVSSILHGLDQLLNIGNEVSKLEHFTFAWDDSPLSIDQHMRGPLIDPLQVCQSYFQQQNLKSKTDNKDCRPPSEGRKPSLGHLDDFKTWIRSYLVESPNSEATKEGLHRLCQYLGEQGAGSGTYHSFQTMENTNHLFSEVTTSHFMEESISYKGLSLLISATAPNFVPEAISKRIYKAIPRVDDDTDANGVSDIVKSQLTFDDSCGALLCPNLNALVEFVWDQIVALTTRNSTSAEQDPTNETESFEYMSVLFETILTFRSWLPARAFLVRYQYLLRSSFEANKKKIESDRDDATWKKQLLDTFNKSNHSLGLLRKLLIATTQMVRILNSNSEHRETGWNFLLDNKDICRSMFHISFDFCLILSLENSATSFVDRTPDVFKRFLLVCSLLESLTCEDVGSVKLPSPSLPPDVGWIFRVIGATSRIPIGTVPPRSSMHVGRQLIQQYERIMNKALLDNSCRRLPPYSWLETYVKAVVEYCQRSVWNSIVSNAWCKTMAHVVCSLAERQSIIGSAWITCLSCYLTDDESQGGDNLALTSALRCLHERIVEQVWQQESNQGSCLAELVLDIFTGTSSNHQGLPDERRVRSLTCIVRSSPPALLFSRQHLSLSLVERLLNTFGAKDTETAGVILLGLALRLAHCGPTEAHGCLRIAHNFVRDCCNGNFGSELVRIEKIKGRVAASLVEYSSKVGLEWWSKVFPCALSLPEPIFPRLDSAVTEVDKMILNSENSRKRTNTAEDRSNSRRKARRATNSSGDPRLKTSPSASQSRKDPPFLLVRNEHSINKLRNGTNGSGGGDGADCRPPVVYSTADIRVDSRDKNVVARLDDDGDSVILLDL